MGALTVRPRSSAPLNSSVIFASCCCSLSLVTADWLTIHASPSTSASTYFPVGCTHTLVAPKMVSGRSVPATSHLFFPPSTSNLSRLNSSGETPSPSILSWSPVGLSSWLHQTTGWVPWTTYPSSRSLRYCQSMNFLKAGSTVLNSLLQSIEKPVSFTASRLTLV